MLVRVQSAAPRFVFVQVSFHMILSFHNGQRSVDLKQLQWFVIGACYNYLTESHQTHLRDNPEDFRPYYLRVTENLIAHLRGKIPLDIRFSDFECVLATEVKQVFGVMDQSPCPE